MEELKKNTDRIKDLIIDEVYSSTFEMVVDELDEIIKAHNPAPEGYTTIHAKIGSVIISPEEAKRLNLVILNPIK